MSQNVVHFNVGGTRYSTSISTITKYSSSMLAAMIEQENEKRLIQEGKELFIDRDGAIFGHLLEYLRHGERMILPQDDVVLRKLALEADFFQLPGLANLMVKAKKNRNAGGEFKIGDYMSLDLTSQWIEWNERGKYCYHTDDDEDDMAVANARAARGIFYYEDVKWHIRSCPHSHAHLGAMDTIDNMIEIRNRNDRDLDCNVKMQWAGKIAGLLDTCAVVEFHYLNDSYMSGILPLHLPKAILKHIGKVD